MLHELFNLASYLVDRHVEGGDGRRISVRTPAGPYTYYSYEQIAELSARAAAVFRDVGARRGDRIAFVVRPSPAWLAAFFGALRLGSIAVPVSPHSTPEILLNLLEDSRPRVVVVEEQVLEKLKAARERLRPEGLLVVGQTMPQWSWEHRVESVEPVFETAETGPESPALVIYEGSTDRCYRHEQVFEAGEWLGRQLSVSRDDIVYCTAPVWSAAGVCGAVALPLSRGASTIFDERGMPIEEILAALRPTLLLANGSVVNQLSRGQPAGSLRTVRLVSCGEPLADASRQDFERRHGSILVDASACPVIGSTATLQGGEAI